MTLSGKKISSKTIKNYETSLEIQRLEDSIKLDERVRNDFLEEEEFGLANDTQSDITEQTIKVMRLRNKISSRMEEVVDNYRFVLCFTEDGSDHYYELQEKA